MCIRDSVFMLLRHLGCSIGMFYCDVLLRCLRCVGAFDGAQQRRQTAPQVVQVIGAHEREPAADLSVSAAAESHDQGRRLFGGHDQCAPAIFEVVSPTGQAALFQLVHQEAGGGFTDRQRPAERAHRSRTLSGEHEEGLELAHGEVEPEPFGFARLGRGDDAVQGPTALGRQGRLVELCAVGPDVAESRVARRPVVDRRCFVGSRHRAPEERDGSDRPIEGRPMLSLGRLYILYQSFCREIDCRPAFVRSTILDDTFGRRRAAQGEESAVPRSAYLDLTYRELGDLDRERTVIVGAVSPVEVHGPHLPLGTDIFIAEEVRDRVGAALLARHPDWTVIDLPTIAAGSDPIPLPGSVEIAPAALEALVGGWARALAEQGFRYWVLLDNHGGPHHQLAIEAAGRKAARRGLHVISPFHLEFRRMVALDPDLLEATALAEGTVGDVTDSHAGTNETSLMLACRPESVRPAYKD